MTTGTITAVKPVKTSHYWTPEMPHIIICFNDLQIIVCLDFFFFFKPVIGYICEENLRGETERKRVD